MKTIFNLDKVKVCLLQPENFYDRLYNQYHESPSKIIKYNGFYLDFGEDENVNDKDITAKLFLIDKPPVELGTFVFNKSKKYGSKCFFSFSTKSLYQIAGYAPTQKKVERYNYFNYPIQVFSNLGLIFNNITYLEIACDTEASVIRKIQYAVSHPDIFDMVLLWKKVRNPEEILEGFYEFYQRSRIKKAPRPTLYIHSTKIEAGNKNELKCYDKARELAQSREDKAILTKVWNDMGDRIQRLEIAVENKQIKRFFGEISKAYPDRWIYSSKEDYNEAIEHFFFDLGMDEILRAEMFMYFCNHLLHFKLRNNKKTQLSVLDLAINPMSVFKSIAEKKKNRRKRQ